MQIVTASNEMYYALLSGYKKHILQVDHRLRPEYAYGLREITVKNEKLRREAYFIVTHTEQVKIDSDVIFWVHSVEFISED